VLRKVFGSNRDDVTGNCELGSFVICSVGLNNFSDEMKEDVVGRACGTYGRMEREKWNSVGVGNC